MLQYMESATPAYRQERDSAIGGGRLREREAESISDIGDAPARSGGGGGFYGGTAGGGGSDVLLLGLASIEKERANRVGTANGPSGKGRRFATLPLNCMAARARTSTARDRLALTVDYGLSGSVFFDVLVSQPMPQRTVQAHLIAGRMRSNAVECGLIESSTRRIQCFQKHSKRHKPVASGLGGTSKKATFALLENDSQFRVNPSIMDLGLGISTLGNYSDLPCFWSEGFPYPILQSARMFCGVVSVSAGSRTTTRDAHYNTGTTISAYLSSFDPSNQNRSSWCFPVLGDGKVVYQVVRGVEETNNRREGKKLISCCPSLVSGWWLSSSWTVDVEGGHIISKILKGKPLMLLLQ
ncbi:unnamed protein product [Nesidiocoris tenuis]|uniref:Uncharacterized protein n=1 Tax=Nesidiocoris tenuis TaxID=355587 RepID=A0A6H5HLI9_9HEMI|nr:unnamed protein product [Nesidiocoris tenuis]